MNSDTILSKTNFVNNAGAAIANSFGISAAVFIVIKNNTGDVPTEIRQSIDIIFRNK